MEMFCCIDILVVVIGIVEVENKCWVLRILDVVGVVICVEDLFEVKVLKKFFEDLFDELESMDDLNRVGGGKCFFCNWLEDGEDGGWKGFLEGDGDSLNWFNELWINCLIVDFCIYEVFMFRDCDLWIWGLLRFNS